MKKYTYFLSLNVLFFTGYRSHRSLSFVLSSAHIEQTLTFNNCQRSWWRFDCERGERGRNSNWYCYTDAVSSGLTPNVISWLVISWPNKVNSNVFRAGCNSATVSHAGYTIACGLACDQCHGKALQEQTLQQTLSTILNNERWRLISKLIKNLL